MKKEKIAVKIFVNALVMMKTRYFMNWYVPEVVGAEISAMIKY